MLVLSGITPKSGLLIVSFLTITLFTACSSRSANEIMVFEELDRSFVNSNNTVHASTEMILMALEDRMSDPATHYKAETWQPKAIRIRELSKELINYIGELKKILKQEAGQKINDSGIFAKDNKEAVIQIFLNEAKGKELQDKLERHTKNLFSIDPHIDSAFRKTVVFPSWPDDLSTTKPADIYKVYFEGITTIAALSLLSKFQNDVKIAENKMIAFCYNKCPSTIHICNFESAIIAQSHSSVRKGEKIEITAGVGSFSWRRAKPEILINGKNVKLEETGVAVCKIKTSTLPGKHYVPVRVSFTDQDLKRQTIEKNIEYTVMKEPGEN